MLCALVSCDRASLTKEKKEPIDDTSIDIFSLGATTPIGGCIFTAF